MFTENCMKIKDLSPGQENILMPSVFNRFCRLVAAVLILFTLFQQSSGAHNFCFHTDFRDSVSGFGLMRCAPLIESKEKGDCDISQGFSDRHCNNFERKFEDDLGVRSMISNSNSIVDTVVHLTYCFGENPTKFPVTGDYTEKLTTVFGGRDSTVTYRVVVLAEIRKRLDLQICNGSSVVFGNRKFDQTGIFLFSDKSRFNGCDSVTELHLKVTDSVRVHITQSICEGDTLFIGNVFYTTPARDTLLFRSVNGCDSILSLDLRLKYPVADTITQFICNDSGLPDGFSTIKLKRTNGCDSLHTIQRIRLDEKKTDLSAKVCRGQGIRVGNSFYDKEGTYTIIITNVGPARCDSIITLELSVVDSLVEYKNVTLCNGETYTYNNKIYRTQASLRNTFVTPDKCDSIYYLNIDVFACVMRYKITARNASCNSDNDGIISIQMQDSAYINYFYTWANLANGIFSSNFLIRGDSKAEIGSLSAGTYILRFDNGAGLFQTDTIVIGKSQPLNIKTKVSDYKGFAVNCNGDRNGSIEVDVSGGDRPYRFLWSDGSTVGSRSNLTSGLYSVTISDYRNCSAKYDTILHSPGRLAARITARDPTCFQESDGSLLLDSLLNALAPVSYSLNDAPLQPFSTFLRLKAGNYEIKIVDGRNCQLDTVVVLNEPPPILVDAGNDTIIDLGESVTLKGKVNIPASAIGQATWNNITDPLCPICLEKKVAPLLSTRYLLSVTDKNKCRGEDFVNVTVKDLQVFIPNTFSPNDDGTNDFFTVFGDPKAFTIKSLRIFNRWGDLVFETANIPPGEELRGWDGKFRGVAQSDGMYVYTIELELFSKSIRSLKGEVFLLK